MKNILILLFVLLCISCNQQKAHTPADGFVINGNVSGFEENTMLYLNDASVNKIIDSVAIIKGKFQFKGKVDQPKKMTLKTKPSKNSGPHKFMSFWVDNGIISFNGNFNDFSYAKVEGLALHEIANKLSKLTEVNYRKANDISKKYSEEGADTKKLSIEMRKYFKSNDSITMVFVKNNPNNYVSLSNMHYLVDKLKKEESQAIYNALDTHLKNTDEGQNLKKFLSIDKIIEKGDQVAALTGKTISGNKQDLIAIVKENKYTILDFWSSGCAPCRLQSKQYRKMYKKYKEKGLEIVSFSLDVKKELWKKASQEDSIPWVDISDLKGYKSITTMTYGIRGIPNSFLINQDGEILKEFIGFFPDKAPFEEDIAEFFDTPSK